MDTAANLLEITVVGFEPRRKKRRARRRVGHRLTRPNALAAFIRHGHHDAESPLLGGCNLDCDGIRPVTRLAGAVYRLAASNWAVWLTFCYLWLPFAILPVYAGELQGAALAMKIKAYDEKGNSIYDEQGELVCEAPSPSMPLYFWNDPDGSKYHHAYFDVYPHVWRHGDYVLIHKDTGGVTFYGRSDAVLKPSGVRIGTAEIYTQMEKLPEIADSLAIGQNYQEDQRVILFVKLAPGYKMTDELKEKIRKMLRENASPRHVPARIVQVSDIPRTKNGKPHAVPLVGQLPLGRPDAFVVQHVVHGDRNMLGHLLHETDLCLLIDSPLQASE